MRPSPWQLLQGCIDLHESTLGRCCTPAEGCVDFLDRLEGVQVQCVRLVLHVRQSPYKAEMTDSKRRAIV
jgi:hypothetical protein